MNAIEAEERADIEREEAAAPEMATAVCFTVSGIPRPGGSKKGFVNKKTGKVIMMDASDNKAWKAEVAAKARKAWPFPPLDGPLYFSMHFFMPRPLSHYRTGKHSDELREDAPRYHTAPPDTTKLIRCAEDALTGILWGDDRQVAYQTAEKTYGDTPGVCILVRRLPLCDIQLERINNE